MTYKIKRINEDKVNAILTALLEEPKTKYTLGKKDGVASSGTIYNYCNILLERKLIIIERKEPFERTGMTKKYYKTTFHGLLHLIKNKVIRPKEGQRRRLKAKIEFPLEEEAPFRLELMDKNYRKNIRLFFKAFEDVAPELFYQYLSSIVFENGFIPPLYHLTFAGLWTKLKLIEMEDNRLQILNTKIRFMQNNRSFQKFYSQNKKFLSNLL